MSRAYRGYRKPTTPAYIYFHLIMKWMLKKLETAGLARYAINDVYTSSNNRHFKLFEACGSLEIQCKFRKTSKVLERP